MVSTPRSTSQLFLGLGRPDSAQERRTLRYRLCFCGSVWRTTKLIKSAEENTAAALHLSTGASRAGRLVRTNKVRRLSDQAAGRSAQPMAPVPNKGLATGPPRMSTHFPTLVGRNLRPSPTVWTMDQSKSAAIAARFSRGGVVWAPKTCAARSSASPSDMVDAPPESISIPARAVR